MNNSDGDQNVPLSILDMVRMFLAPSARGENTVLILETRNYAQHPCHKQSMEHQA